jgi:hypothetical protein
MKGRNEEFQQGIVADLIWQQQRLIGSVNFNTPRLTITDGWLFTRFSQLIIHLLLLPE